MHLVPRFPLPRCRSVLATMTALACVASAQASGLSTALLATGPSITMHERDVDDARAALARAELGMSASLDVTPALEYSGAFDSPKVQTELEPSLDARLRAGYRFDAADILDARIDVLRAETDLAEERRSLILDALRAQVAELRSGLALTEAQTELADAEQALTEARAAIQIGDFTQGQLRDVSLDRDLANTALERAQLDLQGAVTARESLGASALDGVPAERFALPDAPLDEVPRVRLAVLRLDHARSRSLGNSVFSVVDEVRLIGGYAGSDAATYGILSLDRGRPGASVDLRYRADDTDTWVIGIEATFHLDDGTVRAFSRTSRDVADAEAALDRARDDARTRMDLFRRRAIQAREDLDAAVRAIDNSRFRLRELRQALDEARTSGASERDVERAGTAVTRRQGTAMTQRDRLARAWENYVVAVGRYLDEAGAGWVIE